MEKYQEWEIRILLISKKGYNNFLNMAEIVKNCLLRKLLYCNNIVY